MTRKETLYDKDIREPLFSFLEETFGKVRILEEKRTGSARADVVMITPKLLYGIEIKSDADTYTRLEKQVKNYDWYYDRNIAVVGTSHAAHIKEHVPDHWGIITVESDENGDVDFYIFRDASPNPKVKDKRKITILWRTELNRLLERNSLPRYKQKSKLFVQEKLLEKVPADVLWLQAYDELNQIGDADKRNSAIVHLYGVSLAATMIAKKRGLDPEIVSMAAMLHDLHAYKSGSYDDHAHKGADLARDILGKLNLTDEAETETICSAIYHHDDKLTVDSPMDEVLKDADVVHHCMNDLSKPIKEKEQARYDKLCAEFGM